MKLKLLLLTLFLGLNVNLAFAFQSTPTDRNIEGLAGAVKRIDEEEAEMKQDGNSTKEGSKRFVRTIHFDRQGRMTQGRTSIGNFDSRDFRYRYDKHGNRQVSYTLSDLRMPTPARERRSLHVFKFEPGENTLYETVYMGDKPFPENLTQKYKYLFDENLRVLEKTMLTVNNSPVLKDVYAYSTDQSPLERKLYAVGKKEPQIIKYTYDFDSQGNWIKRTEENQLADRNRTKQISITYRKIVYF